MTLAEGILVDERIREACLHGVNKFFRENEQEIGAAADLWISLAHGVVETNLSKINTYCESPLEKLFFRSLQLCFACNMPTALCVMEPPPGDVEVAIQKHVGSSAKAFLSLDTNREPGSLFSYEFEIGLFHAFHLALQPRFHDFYSPGVSVRPDGLIWVPSNPDCRVIVECDGFESHREQDLFVSDRKRDRKFTDKGYTVRRYSGREAFADPLAASGDLFSYLTETFDDEGQLREKWEKGGAVSASAQ